MDTGKLGVVLGMIISCVIADRLYIENKYSINNIRSIIIIEIIANSVLVYITGGLSSYYIWYAMNTVIVFMANFKYSYGWINGIFYIGIMILGSRGEMTVVELNSVLGIICSMGGIQALIGYQKILSKEKQELKETNEELASQNQKNQESLNYVMETYETIYLFATGKSKRRVIRILLDYINFVLKEQQVAFVEIDESDMRIYTRNINEDKVCKIYKMYQEQTVQVKEHFLTKVTDKNSTKKNPQNYYVVPVQYTYDLYGFLIVETERYHEEIKFITSLTSMIMKKIELEKLNERFVINEERNRIANEIHDSILQKLFGISCQLYGASKKADNMDLNLLKQELDGLRNSVNETMSELRETIYGMSWNKEGSNSFIEVLEDYIQETRQRYHKVIQLETQGDLRYMDARQKEAIYRIVCESISNAIRHGKAKEIIIHIEVEAAYTKLYVKDDGQGFDYQEIEDKDQFGLGIKNMNYLVNSLGGDITINTQKGQGVAIEIDMPNLVRKAM